LGDYCVTEAGFGTEMGLEKFCNIKCRVSGLSPDAVGLVATVRGLKLQGGRLRIQSGKDIPRELVEENLKYLEAGGDNLRKHIENVKLFGLPAVVIVNRFAHDTDKEVACLLDLARQARADRVVVSEAFSRGGEGAQEAAQALIEAAEGPSSFKFLYDVQDSLENKIKSVAGKLYGAGDFFFSTKARRQLRRYQEQGFGEFPVCMAKTQYSLSHDPSWLGRPRDFTLPVQEVRVAVGAGFVTPVCGDINLMPGLPREPLGTMIDIDKHGEIVGLT